MAITRVALATTRDVINSNGSEITRRPYRHKARKFLPLGDYSETYRRTIIGATALSRAVFPENPRREKKKKKKKKAISPELGRRRNRTRRQQQREGLIIIAREFRFGHGYHVYWTRASTHTHVHTYTRTDV